MLAIQKYIETYGLEKAILNFDLKSKIYETKILLKYNQLSSPTLMANKEVQECRGLILEKNTWKVMSLGFEKFFNYGETNAHKINLDDSFIFEKLDGTCVQLYFDWTKNMWFAGTTGTAEGEGEVNNKFGTTFNQLFWKTLKEKYNLDESNFIKGFTYVFELTTPFNIVVKPHGESSITLLTVRNLETLKELSRNEVSIISKNIGVPLVKAFDFTIKNMGELLKTFDGMPWSEEGYVLCDSNFNRVKVKNPAYLSVHHLKNKTAEHNIITIVKTNEIEEFSSTFPDRKAELLLLKEKYDNLIKNLNLCWDELQPFLPNNITPIEKKKYAEAVFSKTKKYNLNNFTGLYFGLNDGKVNSIDEYIINFDDKKLYNLL